MASKNPTDSKYYEFLKSLGMSFADIAIDCTHDGYPLSVQEAKFIDLFLAYGDPKQAIKESGCETMVLGKDYILDEIRFRMEMLKKKTIADADEVMQFFTATMRGEIKDQFGLDCTLSDRLNAAKEMAKRTVDVEQKQLEAQDNVIQIRLVRE